MSDSSFSDSESVSGQSDISLPSSISSANLSPLSGFSSSSSSSARFSHSSRGSSLPSSPEYAFRATMEASQDQSSGVEDESPNQSSNVLRESLNQSNDQIAQMLEDIGSITRYCEQLASQVDNFNTTTTSTPTIIQGRRRRLDVTPVEVIDLSNFEFAPPARPLTNRAPDAVIDLCTPDRSLTAHRRNTSRQSTSNAVVVDVDEPSPPKRSCPSLEKSQEDESYKCPVCLENVRRREPVSTKCGHVFCKECLVAAINSVHKCPLCNKKISQRQFSRIYL